MEQATIIRHLGCLFRENRRWAVALAGLCLVLVGGPTEAAPGGLPVGSGGQNVIMRIEQIDRQETPPRLANALNMLAQRSKREDNAVKRRILDRQGERIEQEIERATGFVLRGFTRQDWNLDQPGGLVNLVLHVDASSRHTVSGLRIGDLIRVTLGPWMATVTAENIAYHRAESLAKLNDDAYFVRSVHEPSPWSPLAPEEALARLAKLKVSFSSDPVLGRAQNGTAMWLHSLRLQSRANLAIDSCRLQILAYTIDGQPVGPFDVYCRRASVLDEDLCFGIALPEGQQLDPYEFDLRVKELRVVTPTPEFVQRPGPAAKSGAATDASPLASGS